MRIIAWGVLAALLGLGLAHGSATADNPKRLKPAGNKRAQQEQEWEPDPRSELVQELGMEGVYYLHYKNGALQVKDLPPDSPILLRITERVFENHEFIYEIHYVAEYAKDYDLRHYLILPDGSPPRGLRPQKVIVTEMLDASHKGQVWEMKNDPVEEPVRYKLLLVLVATIWLVPLLWLFLNWIFRPSKEPPVDDTENLTLADQLRPLVEAAVEGSISHEQQARLELLLIGYWRERLGLGDCQVTEALGRMRSDPQAGELLGQLETWLHCPPGSETVDVAKLLEPYRSAKPLDEHALVPQPGATA
ncbi:MAG: hypothetical protein N2C12_17000 [Planctomycetales bacterium]